MNENETKVRTPLFPTYSQVKAAMKTLVGVRKSDVTHMIQAIWEQTGTPQSPVDWSEPDKWIDERLTGETAQLAKRIWIESKHIVNPRHIYGSYLFINGFDLLIPNADGIYQTSERGKLFLGDDKATVQALDDAEGMLKLLNILATKTQAKRGDLLPEWAEFLHEHSKFTSPSTIKESLSRRIFNLVERGLVARDGNTYTITESGLNYGDQGITVEDDRKRDVLRAANHHNAKQRELLFKELSNMHPYKFEHLIRDLLESIGYEDVVVTKESGDKGVDVVANYQFGITTVREVVQVKRMPNSSIGRPLLDQLRGALPYHQAIRGTLITLGTVSKGAREASVFPGAAPISLIDGDKLLDMLIEHNVGIKKRTVELWEVDKTAFENQEKDETTAIEEV